MHRRPLHMKEFNRRSRAEFDAVDPSIQGMFCTCNGDIRHAPAMAEILAAKGAPPVLRINNPEYLYMHEKPNEVIVWMQKTAVQKAHAPDECTILSDDLCVQSWAGSFEQTGTFRSAGGHRTGKTFPARNMETCSL